VNWCYWCEAEVEDSRGDLCGPCVEGETRFLTGATSARKLWRELFG
jgi:hypothetical protein